ncbi:MAG TPA: hypothetical protein VGA00_01185 [Acidiferrobacterales bacterium]
MTAAVQSWRAVALLAALAPGVAGAAWPTLEAPPQSRVEWVGEDMRLNGVAMKVQRFEVEASVGAVLAFYRGRWGTRAEGRSIENELGKWTVIGQEQNGYYLTVQVRPLGPHRSEGLLAVSELPKLRATPNPGADFPKLGGTQMISELESNDQGKRARTLVMRNDFSVQSNVDFYQGALAADGWEPAAGFGGATPDGAGQTHAWRRAGEELQLAVAADRGGATIVVNIVNLGE